jgi:hypothetical protein
MNGITSKLCTAYCSGIASSMIMDTSNKSRYDGLRNKVRRTTQQGTTDSQQGTTEYATPILTIEPQTSQNNYGFCFISFKRSVAILAAVVPGNCFCTFSKFVFALV